MRLNGSALLVFIGTSSALRPLGNELQRQQVLQEYGREYWEETNRGSVLLPLGSADLDTGETKVRYSLTDEEKKERKRWAGIRSLFRMHYTVGRASTLSRTLKKLTPKDMLLLPVAPPLLHDTTITARTRFDEKGKSLYLDKIRAWEHFEKEVRSFTVPKSIDDSNVGVDVLYESLRDGKRVSNEIQEMGFIENHVLEALQEAGLLEHGTKVQAQSLKHSLPLGNADHFLIAGGGKTVPIEFKATHNLLVPEKAVDVVRRYNSAVEKVKLSQNVRDVELTNTGYPLAQLIYYMFCAGSRYGVLSSGTRSYFFKVVDVTNGDPRVLITDAWFVGQPDYLRAWAYLYHLAKDDGDFQPPRGWVKKWIMFRQMGTEGRGGVDDNTDNLPSKRRKRGQRGAGGPPTKQFMTWLDPDVAPSIPRVDGNDIEFVEFLGAGNNEVYLADWKGEKVAVKVYDFDTDLELFENEIRAYEHLKDAWGVLVPEPYFIADKWHLVLLGLQLGRTPSSTDKEVESQLGSLSRTLLREYGFDHLDLEPRNVIYLPDKSGKGKDRLVAIDLELHEIFR